MSPIQLLLIRSRLQFHFNNKQRSYERTMHKLFEVCASEIRLFWLNSCLLKTIVS